MSRLIFKSVATPPPYARYLQVVIASSLLVSGLNAATLKIDNQEKTDTCSTTSATNCIPDDNTNTNTLTLKGSDSVEATDFPFGADNLSQVTLEAKSITISNATINKEDISLFFGFEADSFSRRDTIIRGDLTTKNIMLGVGKYGGRIEGDLTMNDSGLSGMDPMQPLIVDGKTTINNTFYTTFSIVLDKQNPTLNAKTNTPYHILHSNGGITDNSTKKDYSIRTVMEMSRLMPGYASHVDMSKYFTLETQIGGSDIYTTIRTTDAMKQGDIKEIITGVIDEINKSLQKIIATTEKDEQNQVMKDMKDAGVSCTDWNSCKAILETDSQKEMAEAKAALNNIEDSTMLDSLKNSNSTALMSLFSGAMNGKIVDLNNELESINNSINNQGNNTPTNLNISNSVSINARLARFSNPNNDPYKLAFKATIKELSGQKLADSSDVIISKYMQEYLNRFSYENNAWANLLAGYNIVGKQSGYLGGISGGFDTKILDNTLIGGYISYAHISNTSNLLDVRANNVVFGLYQRSEINRNEIDAMLSYTLGFTNETTYNKALIMATNKANYLAHNLNANISYGYVFGDKGFYTKPLAGINLYYSHIPRYAQSGEAAIEFDARDNFNMSVMLGVEMRKYFDDLSYLYIKPIFEQFVVNLHSNSKSRFVGSNIDFTNKTNKHLRNYVQLLIGGDIGINEVWAVTLNAGVNQSIIGGRDENNKRINETYINANAGFKYRF